MEINILEFVKEYKENPVGALEKLEVENYVPFATKRALIDTVIESIIEYDTSLLTYEPMNKHLNFSLTCVVIYTNLTYEDEEGLDAYDALVSSGLLDKIIEMIGVDYDHCKGCGICVEVCPTNPKSLLMFDENMKNEDALAGWPQKDPNAKAKGGSDE